MWNFRKSLGGYLEISQNYSGVPASNWDYDFIEYYRKAYENEDTLRGKETVLLSLQNAEVLRDFYKGTITEIKHLVQLDPTPNLELKEPKWELYKISISFPIARK